MEPEMPPAELKHPSTKFRQHAKTIAVLATCAAMGGFVAKPSPQSRPETDEPQRAHEWRMLSWKDEHGQIPKDGLRDALRQRNVNIAFWQTHKGKLPPTDSWVSIGPNNVGGRTRALVIDPNNTQTMYAGAVGGGVWKSYDGGTTWNVLNDHLASIAIGSLALDPTNPNVIYAGTGEGQFNGDAINGVGIYKSTDAGATWTLLANSAYMGTVNSISVCPGAHNTLLASSRYGGLQRSTDGGQTWTTPYWAQGSFYVAFSKNDTTKAVAQVIDYDFTAGNWFHRAMYTTNGGASWVAAGGLNKVWNFDSRITLAYAPSNNNIVYATCAQNGGEIWKSTDGGHNYSLVSGGTIGCSWYANPLWVDPTNQNVLVAGGGAFFRSTDGGLSWVQITSGYIQTVQPHPDCHLCINDPGYNGTTNRKIWVTTDGGMFSANDAYTCSTSGGWQNKEQTYVTSQFYAVAADGGSGKIIGGTQDNGTLLLGNGNQAAHLMFGGDGGYCAIDPSDPNFCYGEYITLQLVRSTDGGNSAGWIYNGIGDAGTNANFIAPFALSPANPNFLFAGGASLWRSANIKAQNPAWTAVRPPGNDLIATVAVSPVDPNIVWVGQNNGVVSKCANATAASPSWSVVDDNSAANPLPDRFVSKILLTSDPLTAYVALGGFNADDLWQTTDGGSHWTRITGSGATALPSAPIHGIARHPTNPKALYAATEVGIFQSLDNGQSWSTSEFGPANVCTDDIVVMANSYTLVAATHGRGIWTLQLPDYKSLATSFTLENGQRFSGNLGTLSQFDANCLGVLPMPCRSGTDDSPIMLVLQGTATQTTCSELRFRVASFATGPNQARQTVQLYNWSTGHYESIGTDVLSDFDGMRTYQISSNAARFVRASDGAVKAMLRIDRVMGSAKSWAALFDWAQWECVP